MNAERDLRIDSLRGLALCVITVSHLNFSATRWTWDALGHASSAELFVFASGLVSGLVYGRLALRAPWRAVRSKALARARLIYWSYLGLVLYVAAHAYACQTLGIDFKPSNSRLLLAQPGLALALAPFFLYQPGYSDILPMYCVFLALLPLALGQILRGRAALVLGVSAGLWLAAQLGVNRAVLGPVVAHFGVRLPFFDLFAWQILFVFGLWVGARRAQGHPVELPDAPALVWLLLPPLLVSFAIRHELYFDAAFAAAAEKITRRTVLDPLRLANFAALAYLTALLGVRRRSWLEWRWLAFLGQHSLQVFAFSVVAVYFAKSGTIGGTVAQAVTALAVVASLTFPAWLHVRYRALRRARLAPAPLRSADPQPISGPV